MDTTDQKKFCLDSSDEELAEERDVTANDAASEQELCGQDESSAATVCDEKADTVVPDEKELPAEEEPDVSDVVSDPAADKVKECRRYTPHDLHNIAISEVTSTAVELSRHTVIPPEVMEHYKRFGLDERIIRLMFQLQPPAVHSGAPPGISG